MRSKPPRYRPKPKPKPPARPKPSAKPKPPTFRVEPLDCLIALHRWYVQNASALNRITKELNKGKKRKNRHPSFDEIMGGIEKCINRTLEEQADDQLTPEIPPFDLDETIPF